MTAAAAATIPNPRAAERGPAPYQAAYEQWTMTQKPEDLFATVKALQPAIDGVLRSMGGADDPAMRMKAQTLASKAIRTYNPAHGTAMPTWVSRQLLPLRRFKRTALTPVRVPEQIQVEAWHIMQAENEFRDKHMRDPDVEELSDYAKMPVKRIEHIKRTFRRVASQSAFGESTPGMTPSTDFSDEALSYIYRDADKVDRRIIEMKTGYGGSFEPMSPAEIAKRMNLTPVQLSRRSARLAAKLEEIRTALAANAGTE